MTSEIQLQAENVTGGLQIRTMDDLSRVSKMLSASGFFSDAKDASQCGVKVLAGIEMGFGAFASMTGIHIIKGKPSIGAGLMAAAVKRHPNYNYRVIENTEAVCRIEFYEKWDGKMQAIGTSEFTLADAKKAGTQNLDKYARNMLFARAMSNGVKWFCPDVFDAPVYTPEELGAVVDGEGNYIEGDAITISASTVETIAPKAPAQNEWAKNFWAVMRSVGYTKEQSGNILVTVGAIDSEGNPSTAKLTGQQYSQVLDIVGDAVQIDTLADPYPPTQP